MEEDEHEVTDPEELDKISEFRVPDDIDERPRAALLAVIAANADEGATVGRFWPAGIGDDLKTDADKTYGRAVDVLSAAVARAIARDSSGRDPVDLEDVRRVIGYLLAVSETVDPRGSQRQPPSVMTRDPQD